MDYLAAMRGFVRAVDLGSFSRAAQEAGVKVSTISRHVSALEADLGAALLNRSTRGLRLTEIGSVFHEQASRIVAEIDDARMLASSLNAMPQGLLRVTLPSSFGRRHVLPLLGGFLERNPLVRIEATFSETIVDLIETGTDLAIRIGRLADSGLMARKLASSRQILCASPDYVACHDALAEPQDLTGHQTLRLLPPRGATWQFRLGAEGAHEQVKLSGRVRANDLEALHGCAVAGQGVALLPSWLVEADLGQGALVALLPGWEASPTGDFESTIWAVYPPKKVVAPKVRSFIDCLEAGFRQAPAWDIPTPPP